MPTPTKNKSKKKLNLNYLKNREQEEKSSEGDGFDDYERDNVPQVEELQTEPIRYHKSFTKGRRFKKLLEAKCLENEGVLKRRKTRRGAQSDNDSGKKLSTSFKSKQAEKEKQVDDKEKDLDDDDDDDDEDDVDDNDDDDDDSNNSSTKLCFHCLDNFDLVKSINFKSQSKSHVTSNYHI